LSEITPIVQGHKHRTSGVLEQQFYKPGDPLLMRKFQWRPMQMQNGELKKEDSIKTKPRIYVVT